MFSKNLLMYLITCVAYNVRSSAAFAAKSCELSGGAGLTYLWEQAKFDPVERQLTCHISLKDPQTSQVSSQSFSS